MRSILLGLTDIVGSQVTFKSKDGLTDRVTATMTGSERTAIVIDPD
jgi:VCBS repeat-containing protein